MIQKQNDKKEPVKEFKLKSLMIDFDEYLKIHILSQIPAGHADMREDIKRAMDAAWSEVFFAAGTTKRPRQNHLLALRVNMAKVEVYLQEIRDVCYRGKEKRKLDKNSERRFEICAKKYLIVMNFVWGWIKNENRALEAAKSAGTAGLVEKEEMD